MNWIKQNIFWFYDIYRVKCITNMLAAALASHIRLFLPAILSPVPCLFLTHKPLCFCLFHLSNTYCSLPAGPSISGRKITKFYCF